MQRQYGTGWGKDDIVGVHFDSWRGNLQFYVNRKPLGVAYQGLRPAEMFPVVSSTAAKSEVKLITALSFPNNLQFEISSLLQFLPQLASFTRTRPRGATSLLR